MLLMFFGCLDVSLFQIFVHLKDYRKILLVLFVIHLSGPIVVFLMKPFFSSEIYLGLILATVISSGMSVVFLSQLYGGIPSKALVITSLSNILSPLSVPFLVFLFAGTAIAVDFFAMALTVVKLVIVPVIAALLVKKIRLYGVLRDYGTYISIVVLFFLILGIISPVRAIILADIGQSLVLFGLACVFVVINFSLGYFAGSSREEKITYAISGSYKNFTLSTVIALSLFSPVVAMPSVIYSVVNNLSLIAIQFVFGEKKD
ncbi:MAG: hypothetical protein ABIG84_08330 [archaeon]